MRGCVLKYFTTIPPDLDYNFVKCGRKLNTVTLNEVKVASLFCTLS
jgi:hypothetical protein